MILTNLTLKDWKHLKHVMLSDLAPGINVIHGPNKAGKSTLAKAVRIALVDYDHESGRPEVKALTPITDASAVPTAQVGFLAKGQSWTVNKRFTKKKGGGAELREGGSAQLKAEGKNVTQEVVRLLGISKSNEGLGALLWPDQGNATLPNVDQPLGDALRQLLGVQISDRDVGFQGLLDEQLKSWFTPTGKPDKKFGVRDTAVEDQRKVVEELRAKQSRRDELVGEHNDRKVEHVAAHKAVKGTLTMIADLEPRVKVLEDRKQQIKDIKRQQAENTEKQTGVKGELDGLCAKAEAVKQAETKAAEAEAALEPLKRMLDAREGDLQQAVVAVATLEPKVQALEGRRTKIGTIEQQQEQNTKDGKASEKDLSDLKRKAKEAAGADEAASVAAIGLDPLKQAVERAKKALGEAANAVTDAERADVALRKLETRSTALQELVRLESALPTKRQAIERVRETEQQLTALRQELARLPYCTEADRKHLNEVLDELREVEAELRAAAMTVILTPEAEARVGIHADGESREENLAAGATHDVAVLQDTELRLAGWGTVRVKRGEAAGTLSEQRAQRDTLRAELDALRVKLALGELEQGKWVSELANRAATRESKDKEAKKLAKDLKKQAPDGVETLAAELQREEARLAEGKRIAELEEAASVAEALTALGDLAARRDEVDAALERAREERDAAQEAHDTVATKHMNTDRHAQELKGNADAARGRLEDARERTGGEDALNARLAELRDAADKLTEEWSKAQLTDEEKRLPDELEAARETRDVAQQARDQAQTAHKAAVEVHEKAKNDVQATQAVLDAERERTGGEEALKAKLEALVGKADELQRKLDEQQLTPEEERLEETLASEREALRTRERREREISDRLNKMESDLIWFEGLHVELAAAEQRLAGMESTREREKLDAAAHKLIDDWFKEERDKATERSLAPVSEHVQRWLRILNNADDASVEFSGSSLKAESFRLGEQSLALETATSYGELEQLGTLVRLAYACVLAKDEPQAVILDDPLAHSDSVRHRRMLDVLADAGKRNLQIIVLTCHPDRFDQLTGANIIDLEAAKRTV